MKNVKKVTAKPAAVKQVEMKPKTGQEAKDANAKPMALKGKQASVSNAPASAAKPVAKAASAPPAAPQVAKLAAKAAPRRSALPEAEPVLETAVVEVAEETEPLEAPAQPEGARLPEAVAGGPDSSRPAPHVGPPPRPPAPLEVFTEGDHVVYPTHGVGKVERIVTETIAGYQLELIHITFEENRMTLRVPVEKARSAGLRKLASRQLFEAALATLKGRARIKRTMWSRRAQEYEAKINSGDPL
ncbi:MAG TPA: CarD family transcriptional regulator, partial [Acetobacteraceae bacterium]|nr:CarD family transcriptional regulator [Acetobacteraceae bacterium]